MDLLNPSRPIVQPLTWRERIAALQYVPRLLRLIYGTHRGYVAAVLVLRALRALLPLAVLWIGKLIIDGVITARRLHVNGAAFDSWHLVLLLLAELALAIASEGLTRASMLFENLLADLFSNRMSMALMQHAAILDLTQFEDPDTHDRLERARRQTAVRIGLISLLLTVMQDVITLLSLAGVLLVKLPWLLPLLAVAVIPAFLGETHYAAQSYSILSLRTHRKRELEYLRYIGASGHSAKEVKLFELSDFLVGRYRTVAADFFAADKALAMRRSVMLVLLATLGTLGYYGAYAVVIGYTVLGHFTVGMLTFLAGSIRQGRDLIQRILMSFAQIFEQSLHLSDLFTFFDVRPYVVSRENARPVPRPIRRGFEFRNVGFRYPGSNRWAVRHLTCTFAAGRRIALVGENGAGKTSVVKLLTRLYDPDEGHILLDGVDLREHDLTSLRRNMGVIFQDFVRYDFLLRENIAISHIDLRDDEARVRDAARQSLADKVAARLERGYDQMLGRRFAGGVDLSGGEWQKVALARAYMGAAQVLVLDEPTASLDARVEYEVFLRFAEITRGRTAVLISHRFPTVRMADHILVLRDGVLVDQGTHAELVSHAGLYAELFDMQAAGYR